MKTLGALLLAALTFSASAQLRETAVSTASLGTPEGYRATPMAASDGSDFFAVWNDGRGGTFGARITHDGRVLDPAGIFITTAQPRALLWVGGAYVLVTSAADNRSAGIVRLDRNGTVIDAQRRDDAFYAYRLMLTHAGLGDELAISAAAPDQREVALAATPGRPLRAAYSRIAAGPQY